MTYDLCPSYIWQVRKLVWRKDLQELSWRNTSEAIADCEIEFLSRSFVAWVLATYCEDKVSFYKMKFECVCSFKE